ncbi:hypothetical protein C5167_023757 [Papaver somniferum]|uniref:Uncharacterized protein n=1 Tax=Papaver somniferum TaxID=3469 RepID=A0A4Y7JPZ1_PAPSO|nr:hypothetical protein C5167_023757 [Papaver somniferum]
MNCRDTCVCKPDHLMHLQGKIAKIAGDHPKYPPFASRRYPAPSIRVSIYHLAIDHSKGSGCQAVAMHHSKGSECRAVRKRLFNIALMFGGV